MYLNHFGSEIPEFKENYQFISPRIRIMLDGWRLNYRYNYNTPDINQLHPVTNNTNPLHDREGNQDLEQVRTHSQWISTFSFARKRKHRILIHGHYRTGNISNTRPV